MPDFTIKGTIPSKKNSRINMCRGGRPVSIPSNKYREWHTDASWQLKEQKVKQEAIPHIHSITATFFGKTKRKFDLSNKWESVADLLVDYGFIEDDNYEVLPCIQMVYGGLCRHNPRVEIEYVL
jgi:Holliday junction resolvase RusA-like endonuclease